MLYFKRPYSTPFCCTVMHHQSVIFIASQVVLCQLNWIDSSPNCFVFSSSWSSVTDLLHFSQCLLGPFSGWEWICCFQPKIGGNSATNCEHSKGSKVTDTSLPSQPSTPFRLLSKIEIVPISSQSLSLICEGVLQIHYQITKWVPEMGWYWCSLGLFFVVWVGPFMYIH